MKKLLSIILLSLILFGGCSVNPVTLKREFIIISEDAEVSLGKKADVDVAKEFGFYPDKDLELYVNSVGQRIVAVCDRKNLKYYFKVIDSPVLNAFALPGGYVYISRGLLAILNSEAELAGVLAHETGHIVGRHGAKMMTDALGYEALTLAALASGPAGREFAPVSNLLFTSILQGYGREKERQADYMAVEYLYRAGYDPTQLVSFMKNMVTLTPTIAGYQSYNASHPQMEERITSTQAQSRVILSVGEAFYKSDSQQGKKVGNREEKAIKENEYKSHLDGLVYGDRKSPRRLRIYQVKEGDTLAYIAQNILNDKNKIREIELLNGLEKGNPLKPGEMLKIVF